jgi:FkbM family methyltransferase
MISKVKSLIYFFLNPKIKDYKKNFSKKIKIADVGSAGDKDFQGMFWKKLEDISYYYYFDPSNNEKKKNRNYIIFPNGLWDKNEKQKIYITNFPFASSIFKPNQKMLKRFINYESHKVLKEEYLDLKKLDDIIFKKNDFCDFIKIDAEGSELKILNGCKKNLENSLGLEVEINFIEKNLSSPSAIDVIKFLEKNNFTLYLLNRESWRKNNKNNILSNHQLIWADAIFFKSEQYLFDELKKIEDKENKNLKIYKLLALMIVYKLYDTAEYYIDFFEEKKLIDTDQKLEFTNFIKKNIESNLTIFLKTTSLVFISLIVMPIIFLTLSKKIIKSYLTFLKILNTRLITLIINSYRFTGPNKVAVSEKSKEL